MSRSSPSRAQPEFPHVLRVHAVEEVEVVDAVGREPHVALHPRHAIAEPCRDGEDMRAAAGPSHRGELVYTQVVGDGRHVPDTVDDPPAPMALRPAVPGPVIGDEADAQLLYLVLVGRAAEAAPRGAVQCDDRHPLGVAPLGVGHGAAIRHLHRLRHMRSPSRSSRATLYNAPNGRLYRASGW